MLTPTVNASSINFSNKTETSVTVNWSNGNGTNRLLLIRQGNPIKDFPLDGTDYNASPVFGSGAAVGANYAAYNGNGNSVNISGLTAGATYYYRLVEYNKSTATGNNALYLLGSNPVARLRQGPTYTFTGNGNWNNAANWSNNLVPPALLVSGEIVINPAGNGECKLNVPQTISPDAKLTVLPNKKFTVLGNLTLQ
jgi:hypothetical protein